MTTLRRVEPKRVAMVAAALVLLAAVAAHLSGLGKPGSIALGGCFMLANFHLIRLLVSRLIKGGTSRAWSLVLFTLKLLLGIGLVAGTLYQLPVAPLSFAVGATMLLVAAVVDATLVGEPVGALPSNGGSAEVREFDVPRQG